MQDIVNNGCVYSHKIGDKLKGSMQELRQGLDAHCDLVTSILEQTLSGDDLQLLLTPSGSSSREALLEKAIWEAIDVIEQSRKAFKSRRLELLRKDLTAVLVDGGREQNRNVE